MSKDSVANVTIEPDGDGVCIKVRVIARSQRSALAGTRDNALLVRLNAPPVDGAANEELVTFLARLLGVPRRSVTIVSGARSRHKRVRVEAINVAAAEAFLRRA
jgi:uncharacterized protein (TIGR00251 family)